MRELDLRFQLWVRDHHAAVYRSAWRIVRDADDARDVTQEVFLQALRKPDAIARAASPERMLRWLAVKSALAQLRGDRNRRRREEESAMHRPERLPAEQHESRPEEHERIDATRRAVAELPEELRLATTLRFAEGLTFAQVGECLGIAEPTAFERVKKAIEKLREKLTRLGYAAPAGVAGAGVTEGFGGPPFIEQWLATEGAIAESVTVPASLAPALQSLAATATTTLLASKVLVPVAATIAIALGGGYLAVRAARAPDTVDVASRGALAAAAGGASQERPDATRRPIESPASSTQPASPPAADRDRRHGTLAGVVVDDDGRAVAGAKLEAISTEGASKAMSWRGEAVSDAGGAFTLRLPVVISSEVPGNDERGQRYFLTTRHDDFLPHRSDELFVRADATNDLGRMKLRRITADRAGDYTLAVVVVDEAGNAVSGAWVNLHRATGDVEVGGQSDASGVARLSGKRIGGKRLVIDARHLGHRQLDQPIEIAWTGFGEQRFTIERGAVIAGRLVFPEGADVAAETDATGPFGLATQVYAIAADGSRGTAGEDWRFARLERDGAFRISGLDHGRHTLHVRGRCSPVEIDVESEPEAEARERTITLKRTDDVSDRGAHMGEIHGRLVDAVTGAEVIAPWDAFECEPLDREDMIGPAPKVIDEAALRDDLLPSLASARVYQTSFDGSFVPPPPRPEFHQTGLDDGTWLVVARVQGYAPGFSKVITLRERALVKDVVIALERPATARGIVVDGDGRPVEGAFVAPIGAGPRSLALLAMLDEHVRTDAATRHLFLANHARTGADGRFELGGLPALPGQRLAIVHPRFRPATSGALGLRAGEAADAGALPLAPR